MATPVNPTPSADAAGSPGTRRLFWIVFFAALAAQVVMEVFEGVLDYLVV